GHPSEVAAVIAALSGWHSQKPGFFEKPGFSHTRVILTKRLHELAYAGDQVRRAATVAPFVVVPAEHLYRRALSLRNHHRRLRVEDAAVRVVNNVGGDERVFAVFENSLERSTGGVAKRLVDLVH